MPEPDNSSWCVKGGSRGYVTVSEVVWSIGVKDGPHIETIPCGREFESSVPTLKIKGWVLPFWLQPFHWFISPDDPHFLKSALVHDHLLEKGWRYQTANAQWYEVALSVHAPKWKTRIAYLGTIFHFFRKG